MNPERVRRLSAVWVVLILLLLGMTAPGCTITREVYVQDLVLSGPVATPAIHPAMPANEGEFTLSPWVSVVDEKSLRGRISGHTDVGPGGYFEVDTLWNAGIVEFQPRSTNTSSFAGNNFRWTLPGTKVGLDMGYHVSPAVQFTGGIGLATAGGEKWWSWNLGLGIMAVKKKMAIRFDAGIQMQNLSYSAASIDVVTTTWFFSPMDSRAYFYEDSGTEQNVSYYGAVTMNTLLEGSAVNGMLQVGIMRQILADFRPSTSATIFPIFPHETEEHINNKATFVSLTPGIVLSSPDRHRLIAAVRFIWEVEAERMEPGMLIMPVIQCDIVF